MTGSYVPTRHLELRRLIAEALASALAADRAACASAIRQGCQRTDWSAAA